MTAQPNQSEDTEQTAKTPQSFRGDGKPIYDNTSGEPPKTPQEELREKVERYVAALAESGDNFMKPQNIPENLRQDYVNSLVRLIEAEASRRAKLEYERGYEDGRKASL